MPLLKLGGLLQYHVEVFPGDGDELNTHKLRDGNHGFPALASTERTVRLMSGRDIPEAAKKECHLVPSTIILSIG